MVNSLNLVITKPAYVDLDNIFEYIAKDNKVAALELVHTINDKFNDLKMFPKLGAKRTFYLLRDVRLCVVAKHYQIVYTVVGNNLYINRVLSGYQDFC